MTDRKQSELRSALDDERLLLHYQPIHDIGSGRVVTVEALLRQRDDDGEVRGAHELTDAAEKGPHLVALDEWMVPEAFHAAAQWQKGVAPAVRINVNLSPREFESEKESLIERLDCIVSETAIDTAHVTLEITETRYFAEPEKTVSTLDRLKKRGFQLWLDDFGSGHSTMALLQNFPVDGLKIAGGFVKPLVTDRRTRSIVTATIRLAHELGLKVVAEEIEDAEQLKILREAGCDFAQGFLFSKPMPVETLVRFLQAS